MRLARVTHGHRLKEKLILGIIRITTRHRAPDVVRTLLYRRELFGQHQSALTQQVMRGPSDLTVGERELVAAFVSSLGQCVF